MIRYRLEILKELKKAGYSSYRLRQEKVLGEGTLQQVREIRISVLKQLVRFAIFCLASLAI